MRTWHQDLENVLDKWSSKSKSHQVIISPDIDGLTSAAILNQKYPLKIIGIYTTTHLLMLEDHNVEDSKNALWLDHDVSRPGIICVGQHLVHHKPSDSLPLRENYSWNPNVWVKQSWEDSFKGVGGKKRDKYPFGTAHFLWDFVRGEEKPSPIEASFLAHADGTWFALDCYKANGAIWTELMFKSSEWAETLLDYKNQHQAHKKHLKLVNELFEIGYKSQSRATKAQLLPDDLRQLTGRQSLNIRMTSDPQKYLDRIIDGLGIIGTSLGSMPSIGKIAGSLNSGERILEYPNRISDFDQLMIDKNIFSHAFTDFRSLSYTVNLPI